MAQNRTKAKGRREKGPFVPLPCSVLEHPNFKKLSAKGTRLLIDMCSQLRFKQDGPVNNGDLHATLKLLKDRSWNSNESLRYAINELTHYGFIVLTRQGGRNVCNLYAITWWAINECNGKLDYISTPVPLNCWKETRKKWKRPKRKLNSLGRFPSLVGAYNGLIRVNGDEKFTH